MNRSARIRKLYYKFFLQNADQERSIKICITKWFTNRGSRDILCVGKEVIPVPNHKEPLGNAIPRGSFLGCAVLTTISVQPFAYVVGNYTCYDRDQKRSNTH